MDLNLASGSSSIPVDQLAAAQMHNFMPMPPPFINRHHHPSSPSYLPPHPHPISHGEVEVEGMQSQLLQQTEKHIMQLFWNQRWFEVSNDSGLRSHHELPLARIKKIMKADEEVKMVSGETPVLFSKACELFIMELTLRSWLRTEDSKRRTLQRCDIERAIRQHDVLDFLLDSFPPLRHHLQECSIGNQDNSGECLVGTSMS